MLTLRFFVFIVTEAKIFENLSDVCTDEICLNCSRIVNFLKRSHGGCEKVLSLKGNISKFAND